MTDTKREALISVRKWMHVLKPSYIKCGGWVIEISIYGHITMINGTIIVKKMEREFANSALRPLKEAGETS